MTPSPHPEEVLRLIELVRRHPETLAEALRSDDPDVLVVGLRQLAGPVDDERLSMLLDQPLRHLFSRRSAALARGWGRSGAREGDAV